MTETSSVLHPRHPTAWDRLLVGLLVVLAAYALALIVAGDAVDNAVFEPLGFGLADDAATAVTEHVRLLRGVLGAVLLGWLALLLALALGPLRRREPWAWNATATSLGVWFLADTTFSLVVGAWQHALFNAGFAVVLAVPLAAVRRPPTAGP